MNLHSEYKKAVQAYIHNDGRALMAFLKSNDASNAEKNLIRARQSVRVGEYDKALEILNVCSSKSDLIQGEIHFVRANILSHQSQWQTAIVEAQQAVLRYSKVDDKRGLFLANYNLSVYFNRLGLDSVSVHHIEQAEKHVADSAQTSLVHRAYSCHYSRLSQFDKALSAIEQALRFRADLDEVDRAALDSVAADIYFRTDHLDLAATYLESLAFSKVIRDKARVRFDLIVLRATLEGKPRFVQGQPNEIIAENAEYLLRWQVLENLQNGDWTLANKRWNELCEMLPLRFKAGFECLVESDKKTIFMTAVAALLSSRESVSGQTSLQALPKLSGKMKKLFEALSAAPIALRKEEIIEQVWETSYHPDLDNRFYKLVERLKKEAKLPIENVNQTYRLGS